LAFVDAPSSADTSFTDSPLVVFCVRPNGQHEKRTFHVEEDAILDGVFTLQPSSPPLTLTLRNIYCKWATLYLRGDGKRQLWGYQAQHLAACERLAALFITCAVKNVLFCMNRSGRSGLLAQLVPQDIIVACSPFLEDAGRLNLEKTFSFLVYSDARPPPKEWKDYLRYLLLMQLRVPPTSMNMSFLGPSANAIKRAKQIVWHALQSDNQDAVATSARFDQQTYNKACTEFLGLLKQAAEQQPGIVFMSVLPTAIRAPGNCPMYERLAALALAHYHKFTVLEACAGCIQNVQAQIDKAYDQ